MNVILIHDPEKVGLPRATRETRGIRGRAGRNSICMLHDLFSLRADLSSGRCSPVHFTASSSIKWPIHTSYRRRRLRSARSSSVSLLIIKRVLSRAGNYSLRALARNCGPFSLRNCSGKCVGRRRRGKKKQISMTLECRLQTHSEIPLHPPVGNFPTIRWSTMPSVPALTHLPRVLSNCAISRVQVHPFRHASLIPLVTPNAAIYICIATCVGIYATRFDCLAFHVHFAVSTHLRGVKGGKRTNTPSIFFRTEIRDEYEADKRDGSSAVYRPGQTAPRRTKERASNVNTKIPFTSLAQT